MIDKCEEKKLKVCIIWLSLFKMYCGGVVSLLSKNLFSNHPMLYFADYVAIFEKKKTIPSISFALKFSYFICDNLKIVVVWVCVSLGCVSKNMLYVKLFLCYPWIGFSFEKMLVCVCLSVCLHILKPCRSWKFLSLEIVLILSLS